jgi:hypothetical protein
MTTTLPIAKLFCIAAALAVAGPAAAQNDADYGTYDGQTETPPTTRERVAALKTRHQEALTALTSALGRISTDPSQVTSAETFAAVDKADRDMRRSQSACDSIQAALRKEAATIKADSAFSDEQKAELESAAKAMADECAAIRTEAGLVIKNLAKSYKLFPKWKRVHKSYLNLQGESEANAKLAAAVDSYLKALTTPEEAVPAADPSGGAE